MGDEYPEGFLRGFEPDLPVCGGCPSGRFFRHGEIYRQLPLYCFLEKKALQKENGRDRETEMLLQEKTQSIWVKKWKQRTEKSRRRC